MLKIKSYGKFNLYLKVYKKRAKSELHNIKSVMVPYTELYDEIIVSSAEEFRFVEKKNLLDKKENTVIEAVRYFFMQYPAVNKKIRVELIKNAPIGSGLGYSASNAVATYKLLHQFYNLELTEIEALKFAKYIASDATFFLFETPMRVEKDGTVIKPFLQKVNFKAFKIILNKDISCITKQVYDQFDHNYHYYKKNFVRHDVFYNYLELPCLDLYPELYDQYVKWRHKYQHVMVSGAGSSFVCFNDDWNQ